MRSLRSLSLILFTSFASIVLSASISKRGLADDYAIKNELARGGFGRVYRARRRSDGLIVVLKKVDRNVTDKLDACRQIENEITILRRLNHPSIIWYLDWYRDIDGHIVMVQELGGDSLKEKIDAGALTPREKRAIFRDIVRGVGYLHSKAVCHRDIKPENVIMSMVCVTHLFT